MSQKRKNECSEDSVDSKILKLVEDSHDVTLDNFVLSEGFKSCLEYDSLQRIFSVTLEKERKEGNRCICIGEREMHNIIKLLPVTEKLVCRYSVKRSPKPIDIPFETGSGDIGDLITVVSLKENIYKKGNFDVDIRKCVKKEEEGSYQYTSQGVHFSHALMSELRGKLLQYQTIIKNVTEKTREVVTVAVAVAIKREIEEIADPRKTCQGCQIQHPSQAQHVDNGGCLSEQPAWDELCDQYWHAASVLIKENEVQNLAKRAASRIPELRNVFLPGLISSEQIPHDVVKDIVQRKVEMENETLFKTMNDM